MPSVNRYGETATIVVTSIKAILYLGFLVLYVLRIKKLDSLASNNFL